MFEVNAAREKYRPTKIKLLFVAEAPPKKESKRFFYFEKVDKGDSLFIEMIAVLFKKETADLETKELRRIKPELLKKFKAAGYFLIDAMDEPMREVSTPGKTRVLKTYQQQLLDKIRKLNAQKAPVVLISRPVYDAMYDFLKAEGVNVVNKEMIDFPGSGGQKKFREKMRRLELTIKK